MDNKKIVAYCVILSSDSYSRGIVIDKDNFKNKLYYQIKYAMDKETMMPVQSVTVQLIDGTHTGFKRSLYDTYSAQGISLSSITEFKEYIAKTGMVIDGYDAETFFKTIEELTLKETE